MIRTLFSHWTFDPVSKALKGRTVWVIRYNGEHASVEVIFDSFVHGEAVFGEKSGGFSWIVRA